MITQYDHIFNIVQNDSIRSILIILIDTVSYFLICLTRILVEYVDLV